MTMHLYVVGQLYHPDRREWTERVEYNYREGGHELRMFLADPSRAEIDAVTQGGCEFAVAIEQGVLFFLYRFSHHPPQMQPAFPWSDAPYSWWLVPDDQRTLPNPEPDQEERILLSITLVDASTGIIKGLRAVSISPQMSAVLHQAIREQAAHPFVGDATWQTAIDTAYRKCPESNDLLRVAKARCVGGA